MITALVGLNNSYIIVHDHVDSKCRHSKTAFPAQYLTMKNLRYWKDCSPLMLLFVSLFKMIQNSYWRWGTDTSVFSAVRIPFSLLKFISCPSIFKANNTPLYFEISKKNLVLLISHVGVSEQSRSSPRYNAK